MIFLFLAVPSLSNPTGPPGIQNNELTAEVGCSCHGAGSPSSEVLVQISGVPESYVVGAEYTFVISGDAADSTAAGKDRSGMTTSRGCSCRHTTHRCRRSSRRALALTVTFEVRRYRKHVKFGC